MQMTLINAAKVELMPQNLAVPRGFLLKKIDLISTFQLIPNYHAFLKLIQSICILEKLIQVLAQLIKIKSTNVKQRGKKDKREDSEVWLI